MAVLVFSILAPVGLALWIGWSRGHDGPTTPGEFARSLGFAFAWAIAVIFLWQALWMFSVGTAGLAIVAQDAGFWTLVSGVIWAPLMVIAYIIRARRRLRE